MPGNDPQQSAFGFSGSWKEFAPIALTNLLLTIVTLGMYRFWAKTRERRYLWSHTRFIDDRLEWTGTGKELFLGFTMAALLIAFPLFLLNFAIQALAMRGYTALVAVMTPALYLFLIYIFGIARFRALRYRLSRTYWHGIRGGSEDSGWSYGWSSLWKSMVGAIALGLLIPWSMCELWNERWNTMSFGPHPFTAGATSRPLMGRYLLFYLLPVAGCIAAVGAGVAAAVGEPNPQLTAVAVVFAALGAIAAYFAFGLIALAYYAKFFREAVGNLTLTHIDFAFTARTADWFKLFLGDLALLIITFGIAYAWLGYRHWKFFITHLEASGEVDLALLTQSETPEPTQGEGLLDAFDVGAF
jgi:uncharacterized membrane protein YjgN (DUF898 family)